MTRVRYSVMEVRKLMDHDVIATLRRHTDMLDQQTRLLEAMVPTFARMQEMDRSRQVSPEASQKPEEPWSLDFWRSRPLKSEKYEKPSVSPALNSSPMETFGSIQQQLQPVLARAEALVLEALDRRDEQVLCLAQSKEVAPLEENIDQKAAERTPSTDSLLGNQFVVLCNSFQHRLQEIENLEQRCRDIVQYLKSAQDQEGNGGHAKAAHLVSEEF